MSLTIRQLEVVRAVARHGAITLAAAELGVSQPAVSMMLRESAASCSQPRNFVF
jgi:DNA-binding transcriptional LysR family regulator